MKPPAAATILRAVLCVLIIVCGLGLRRYGFGVGLSAFVVKYGGSALWAAMVFFLTAMAAPRLSGGRIALIAGIVAIAVELFRLVHTPWLDEFRLTLAGALLLGRIYSIQDLIAYGVGIGAGVLLDRLAATMLNPRASDAVRDASHSAS